MIQKSIKSAFAIALKPAFFSIAALLACLTLQAQAQAQENADAASESNGVVAQVNQMPITLDELRREIIPFLPELRQRSRSRLEFDRNLKDVSQKLLEQIINRILIVESFEKAGYQISEEHAERIYQEHLRKRFKGSRARFLQYLQDRKIAEREFRKKFIDDQIIAFMKQQKIQRPLSISPQKVLDYYKKNKSRYYQEPAIKLRLIVLKPLANENQNLMQQQAEAILKDLRGGKDFAELAKQHSQGPKAERGGDWGWIKAEDLQEELSKVAFGLKAKQHSKAIQLGKNIYILEVESKREGKLDAFNSVQAQIEQNISLELTQKAYEQWIKQIRSKAYIQYFLEEADGAVDMSPKVIHMELSDKFESPPRRPKPKKQFRRRR